jgi:hypothetical protein
MLGLKQRVIEREVSVLSGWGMTQKAFLRHLVELINPDASKLEQLTASVPRRKPGKHAMTK